MDRAQIFALIAGAVVVTAVCRRRGWSAPLVLVAAGLVVSYIPGVPEYDIDPQLILEFVLPPLLFSAARSSSYQDMRRSLNSIVRLGVGLVLVSAVAVALVAWALIPDLPFAAALVLGAVVAPPDAVAAAAVGRKLGLPRRVMTVISGESLINDATSLTLYKVALAGAASGAWAFSEGLTTFALAVLVGVALGLVIGWVVHQLRLRFDDSVVSSTIALLTPFACYWGAEHLGGSGVLAVVAAGLYLGHTAPSAGYATRLVQDPIWETLDLLLESFTFALIGVQLPWLIADVNASNQGLGTALLLAAAVLGTAMVVRPLYVFATAWVDHLRLPGSHRDHSDALSVKESAVVSWAGMRGVVTLAAAAGIPALAGGVAFPDRATLQLVAYSVAIGTLLLQGLTLPWLIHRLGVRSDDGIRDRAQEARLRISTAKAAQQVIEERREQWTPQIGAKKAALLTQGLAEGIARKEKATAIMLDPSIASEEDLARVSSSRSRAMQDLRRDIVAAQRAALVAERDAGNIDEVVMRQVLRELDLEDESLDAAPINRI
ncbi:Na+/H+ antiporter [Cellulomonas sp. NPDC089187]|uniref:Na+/H+ antiporter n=1 Tax=Cellulomonas sp. NPDC089187 TaxID=3154970 RepID=UPI0034235E56